MVVIKINKFITLWRAISIMLTSNILQHFPKATLKNKVIK